MTASSREPPPPGRLCPRCQRVKLPRYFRVPTFGTRESNLRYSKLCQSCHPAGAYRPKGVQSASTLRAFAEAGLAPSDQVERTILARRAARALGPKNHLVQLWLAPIYHFRRDRDLQTERLRLRPGRRPLPDGLRPIMQRYVGLMALLIEHTKGVAGSASCRPPTPPAGSPDAYEHLLESAPLLRKEILALQLDFDLYCEHNKPPQWRSYPILLRSTLRPR